MQSAAPNNLCTAATSFCGILGGDGSLSSETASVLVFEMGHKPTHAAQQARHGLQACIMATRRRSEPFHAWQPAHKTTIAVRRRLMVR